MLPAKNRVSLGVNASVLLDVVRFAAAVAVALSHMPDHLVAAAPLISEHSGNQAVCVFFVLSGFMIRYVTVTRVTTGREYFIDRTSRIYSVVLPLLIVTFLLEPAAAVIRPATYHSMLPTSYTWAELPGELFYNLTFTVGWWGSGSPPFSNGPFWSLSYECVYYALYGIWIYRSRERKYLVPLLLLAVGPGIAFLFPIWLLGVALHDVYARWRAQNRILSLCVTILSVYCVLLWASRRRITVLLNETTHQLRIERLSRFVASFELGRQVFHGATLHWLDHLSVSFFFMGPLVCLALLPVLISLERLGSPLPPVTVWCIRIIADSTFTLYLLHWPLLLLSVCLRGSPFPNWRSGICVLMAIVTISIMFARLLDQLKVVLRLRLRVLWSEQEEA